MTPVPASYHVICGNHPHIATTAFTPAKYLPGALKAHFPHPFATPLFSLFETLAPSIFPFSIAFLTGRPQMPPRAAKKVAAKRRAKTVAVPNPSPSVVEDEVVPLAEAPPTSAESNPEVDSAPTLTVKEEAVVEEFLTSPAAVEAPPPSAEKNPEGDSAPALTVREEAAVEEFLAPPAAVEEERAPKLGAQDEADVAKAPEEAVLEEIEEAEAAEGATAEKVEVEVAVQKVVEEVALGNVQDSLGNLVEAEEPLKVPGVSTEAKEPDDGENQMDVEEGYKHGRRSHPEPASLGRVEPYRQLTGTVPALKSAPEVGEKEKEREEKREREKGGEGGREKGRWRPVKGWRRSARRSPGPPRAGKGAPRWSPSRFLQNKRGLRFSLPTSSRSSPLAKAPEASAGLHQPCFCLPLLFLFSSLRFFLSPVFSVHWYGPDTEQHRAVPNHVAGQPIWDRFR